MVPGGRPLITIGYKYNARKVLYFIVTENSGSPQASLTYLFNHPDQSTNVSISSVARPLVMYKFLGAINEVKSHKKSRQSYLDLDKIWVTQCCGLRLCMTVYTRMTITNCWKRFCCGANRDHYDKLIGIR